MHSFGIFFGLQYLAIAIIFVILVKKFLILLDKPDFRNFDEFKDKRGALY
jgi:hypothetical protein